MQVERRTGKVRRPKTDVPPLCHATNQKPIKKHRKEEKDKPRTYHYKNNLNKYLKYYSAMRSSINTQFIEEDALVNYAS